MTLVSYTSRQVGPIKACSNALTGAGERHDLAQMAHSFPTASLAVLDFRKDWRDIGELDGRLERFIKARDLREV